MLDYLRDANTVIERIEDAAKRTAQSFAERTVNQEPHFTDRLLSRIEDAVNATAGTRARWTARTLTDRGPGAEESLVGADFHGSFEVFSGQLRVGKGFLAQAKMLAQSASLSASEHSRLQEQCERMLAHSPDAFVFLYSESGVRVVSATVVNAASERTLDELGTKQIGEFFLDHFKCFIGDPRLRHPTIVDRLLYYPSLRPPNAFVRSSLRITVLANA